ncbi:MULTISPECIES: hypothetical protein [Streptomyces]|uniref:Uncharacterized protein n=2 Tax=Streptomyces TaxID=1883 RepID=A0A646KRE1_STRJU|nr:MULTISPECIES: hypothetical protein [Streptomyces]MQS35479.1 hypothetical protein [Streptomyces katsurahamanus]MQT04638.1 hypothetical protein [Streptomyces jumonjinensis]
MDEQTLGSLTVHRGRLDGQLYVRAEDVTALLRGIADSWTTHAEAGDAVWAPQGRADIPLDPHALHTLAEVLTVHADQFDVQCIALADREPDA